MPLNEDHETKVWPWNYYTTANQLTNIKIKKTIDSSWRRLISSANKQLLSSWKSFLKRNYFAINMETETGLPIGFDWPFSEFKSKLAALPSAESVLLPFYICISWLDFSTARIARMWYDLVSDVESHFCGKQNLKKIGGLVKFLNAFQSIYILWIEFGRAVARCLNQVVLLPCLSRILSISCVQYGSSTPFETGLAFEGVDWQDFTIFTLHWKGQCNWYIH